MKKATRSASERALPPEEKSPGEAKSYPDVEPEPAVWETGFMASRRASRIPALYRPRKMTTRQPEPTW